MTHEDEVPKATSEGSEMDKNATIPMPVSPEVPGPTGGDI